jgi:hypothetical protein
LSRNLVQAFTKDQVVTYFNTVAVILIQAPVKLLKVLYCEDIFPGLWKDVAAILSFICSSEGGEEHPAIHKHRDINKIKECRRNNK